MIWQHGNLVDNECLSLAQTVLIIKRNSHTGHQRFHKRNWNFESVCTVGPPVNKCVDIPISFRANLGRKCEPEDKTRNVDSFAFLTQRYISHRGIWSDMFFLLLPDTTSLTHHYQQASNVVAHTPASLQITWANKLNSRKTEINGRCCDASVRYCEGRQLLQLGKLWVMFHGEIIWQRKGEFTDHWNSERGLLWLWGKNTWSAYIYC